MPVGRRCARRSVRRVGAPGSGCGAAHGGAEAAAARGCKAAPRAQKTAPMSRPPATLAPVPTADTPPLVPGGTRLQVVTRRGEPELSTPSSEAQVSALQQA